MAASLVRYALSRGLPAVTGGPPPCIFSARTATPPENSCHAPHQCCSNEEQKPKQVAPGPKESPARKSIISVLVSISTQRLVGEHLVHAIMMIFVATHLWRQ